MYFKKYLVSITNVLGLMKVILLLLLVGAFVLPSFAFHVVVLVEDLSSFEMGLEDFVFCFGGI
jgi:hypothetical protein